MIVTDQFDLGADRTGLVLSYIGCIGMLTQGFGLSWIMSKFSEKRLFQLSVFSLALSYAALVSTMEVCQLMKL